MSDIKAAVRPRSPAEIITDAVNVALTRNLPVAAIRDPGVVLASTHVPSWERDPRATEISPLGAVLLIEQPAVADLDRALAYTLDVSIAYHLGFELGCAGEKLSASLEESPAALLAAEGYLVGVQMKELLDRRAKGLLPGGLVSPSRTLIAELISSLTVSQVLEALIDSIPGRQWSDEESADAVIEFRALADDYRSVER